MNLKKTAQLTGHNASIYALSTGLQNDRFYSAGGDGWIVEWNFKNPDIGKLIGKVDVQLYSLLMLSDHKTVVAGDMNGGVHWIDLKEPEKTKGVSAHRNGVFGIHEIDGFVYSLGGEGRLTKWSVEERRQIESFHLTNQSLRCLAFSKQRNELAIGASDNAIYFLDAPTLDVKHKIDDAHENSVFCLCFSSDEKIVFSGGRDAHLNAWQVDEKVTKVDSKPAHWYTINSIVNHPSKDIIATASRDKTIKIWEAKSLELLKVLETGRDGGHLNSVNQILWHQYEETLVSCSDDRTIILWKVEEIKTGSIAAD